MHIRAFRPLLPSSNTVARELTCPPYDVLSLQQASQYATNPNSFIHVIRPDASLPDAPPHCPTLYQSANKALHHLQSQQCLTRDSAPSLYVYQLSTKQHTQTGLVALVSAQDYRNGTIRRHENTRAEKERDRTLLTDTLSANTGPVFLAYRDVDVISDTLQSVCANGSAAALFDIVAEEDGVTHRVWRMPKDEQEAIVSQFDQFVPLVYIADGHHRAASAANVANMRAEKHGLKSDCAYFLAVLFPESELHILAYNRIVRDLNGMTVHQAVHKVSSAVDSFCKMELSPNAMPKHPATVFMYVGEQWYSFDLPSPGGEESGCALADTLDCAVLQDRVLQPIFGIEDARKSDRVEFVGGNVSVAQVAQRASRGVAFLLHPVRMQQLMAVADAQGIMPPKSTWFEPKLRSGFFVHTF